jgi:hypothetical protein
MQISLALLATLASPIKCLLKLPRGAIKGFVDSLKADMIGNPLPIRTIFTSAAFVLSTGGGAGVDDSIDLQSLQQQPVEMRGGRYNCCKVRDKSGKSSGKVFTRTILRNVRPIAPTSRIGKIFSIYL